MLNLFPALLVVLLSAASSSPTAASRQGELYRDPDGRFTVAVAAGWKASAQGAGIKIARGSAYAWISPFEGASSASQVVTMLAGQFASQWKEFDEVDRGKHTLSGQPARFAVYRGVNPAGVASRLRVAGVVWQQEAWALVLSAPEEEYGAAQSTLESIEKSFVRVEPGARRSGGRDESQPPASSTAAGQRAVLGVALRDLEPGEAQRFGLERPVGVVVVAVMPDGPSEAAGIRADDVIVSVDRQPTEHPADVPKVCNAHRPGDEVEVVFVRHGKRQSARVRLIATPGSGPAPETGAQRGRTDAPSPRPAPSNDAARRTGSERGSQPAYYRMKMVQLMDREGFAEPVEAARMLIPSDWRWEGGIHWNTNAPCSSDAVRLEARATSPDGLWCIEFFNPYSWQWSDDPAVQQLAQTQGGAGGCPMGPPVGAADFIRQAVPRARPGARIVGAEPLPRVAQAQQRAGEEQLVQMMQSGMATGYRVDAARVRLAYAIDGKPVEEWASGTIKTLALRATSASAAMNGQMAYTQSYNILADDLIAIRAPAGELDKQGQLFASILASIQKNQRYLAALQQVFNNVGKAEQQGVRDRSRIWSQYANETNEIITQSYANQQAVQDGLAQQYSESIRGIETFVNPATQERVELVGGYDQAWVNNRGEYILSSEPGFNPGVTLQEDWVELQRTRR